MSGLTVKNKSNLLLALAATGVICAVGAMLSPFMAVLFYLGMILCLTVVFMAEKRSTVAYGALLMAVIAVGGCTLLMLKLGLSAGASMSSALFALSGIAAVPAIAIAHRMSKDNVVVMVAGALVLVALWAGSFFVVIYEARSSISAESIVGYFTDTYKAVVDILAEMPQMDAETLAVLRDQQQMYGKSVCKLLLGFGIAAAEAVVFVLMLCMRKILAKLGNETNFASLLAFRMDKIGAILFVVTDVLTWFSVGSVLSYIVITVYYALFVPFAVAGIGAVNAILTAMGVKKGWRIALIVVMLFSCIGVIPFVGAIDSFTNYRARAKLFNERVTRISRDDKKQDDSNDDDRDDQQ